MELLKPAAPSDFPPQTIWTRLSQNDFFMISVWTWWFLFLMVVVVYSHFNMRWIRLVSAEHLGGSELHSDPSLWFFIQLETFSAQVGIPMNCIFPVKNYHNEIDLNSEVGSLLLSALIGIINFGDDFIRSSALSMDWWICGNNSKTCVPWTKETPYTLLKHVYSEKLYSLINKHVEH